MKTNKKSTEGFPGLDGPTLQDKIRRQMDRQGDKAIVAAEKHTGDVNEGIRLIRVAALAQGRYEGMAAALAVLRSSNLADELKFSEERRGL